MSDEFRSLFFMQTWLRPFLDMALFGGRIALSAVRSTSKDWEPPLRGMGSGCAPLTSLALPCGHPPTHHQPRTLGLPASAALSAAPSPPSPFPLPPPPEAVTLAAFITAVVDVAMLIMWLCYCRLCENRRYRLHACLLLRPGLDTVPGRRCCGRDGDARRRHHKSYLVGSAVRLFREEPSVPRFRRAVSSLPPQTAARSYRRPSGGWPSVLPCTPSCSLSSRAVPPSPNIRSPADRSYKPSPASCLPLSSSRPYASAM